MRHENTFFLHLLLPVLAMLGCAHYNLRAESPGAVAQLPRDHAPHAHAQTEWWHVHADLEDVQTGEPVHLFAAFLVERTDLDRVGPLPVSPFANPFHVAYVKIQTRDKTWVADRENFPDLIAARFVGDGLDLRHGDWRIAYENGALTLNVGAGRHAMELKLDPTGAAILPGEGGLVELRPGARHMWVQHEGMKVEGKWRDGRETRWVQGTGFLKHQWGRLYDDNVDGFQWFSLDLPDGGGLSIAWLAEDGMHGVEGSRAMISTDDGKVVDIPVTQLKVTPTRTWKSRRSKNPWPVAWHIEGAGIDLDFETGRDDQELWVFPAALYAGPARAKGTVLGEEIDTKAFVEQVGAKQPFWRFLMHSRAPMEQP
jgi:predicted secreted hydrolase